MFTVTTVLMTLSPLSSPQSQNLIFPSQPAVATLLASCGCQSTWIQTSSWAFHLDNSFVVFQSQM